MSRRCLVTLALAILVLVAPACSRRDDAGPALVDRARLEIGWVADAVEMFFLQHRRLPKFEELLIPDAKGQPWLQDAEALRDPWGHDYRLVPGTAPGTFTITSDGPDGVPDNEDDVSSRGR